MKSAIVKDFDLTDDLTDSDWTHAPHVPSLRPREIIARSWRESFSCDVHSSRLRSRHWRLVVDG